jgi:hypothetical protein
MGLPKLMELAGFFTAHGIWTITEHPGPLVPMTASERDGERSLTRLDKAASREQAVANAKKSLDDNDEDAERGIVVYDAYVTIDDQVNDALVIYGVEYGPEPVVVEIIQPYRPNSAPGGFAVMRPKVSLPESIADDAEPLIEAFFRGLDSHEEGGPIWKRSLAQG